MRELDLIQHKTIKNPQGLGAGAGCGLRAGYSCEQLAFPLQSMFAFPKYSNCASKQAPAGPHIPQLLTPKRPSHRSLPAGRLLKGDSGGNKAPGFLQHDTVLVGVGHAQLRLMPACCVTEQAWPSLITQNGSRLE